MLHDVTIIRKKCSSALRRLAIALDRRPATMNLPWQSRRFVLSDPELVPGYRHSEVVSNDGTWTTSPGKKL